jgi:hypothetical protein
MKTSPLWLTLLCIACPLSAQAAIYKCLENDTVTYRDTPCENADATQFIVASIRPEPGPARFEPNAGIATETKPETAPQVLQQSPGLTLGMLDTQVLNLRGWGRPGKITRNKSNRAWREEWTYFSPRDGERQLQFANGKLTAIQ